MKCTVCGEDFEGIGEGSRSTTVNQRDGKVTISTVITAVCPKCTLTKEIPIVIEKYIPSEESNEQ
jgi:hypothetical protein